MPRNTKPLPEDATLDMVRKYCQKFVDKEEFALGERVVKKVFAQYPDNTSFDSIMIKSCVLNTIAHTKIYAIDKVASRIFPLKIDHRIISGDKTLVNEIAQVRINEKSHRNFYSFASKYCHFHNPVYPIYDSFVEEMLVHYQIKSPFMVLSQGMNPKTKTHIRKHLEDYGHFSDTLEAFKNKYGLQNCSTEEIDHFLWIYGHELYDKKSEHFS